MHRPCPRRPTRLPTLSPTQTGAGAVARATGVVLALLAILLGVPSTARAEGPIRIGVLAYRGVAKTRSMWKPTADYLTETIPGKQFEIVPVTLDNADASVRDQGVEFIITHSGQYAALEYKYGITRMATLRSRGPDGNGYTRFGGVVFTRADRTDIQSVRDLRGRSFMAVDRNSFAGYQAQAVEMRELGFDVERDAATLLFSKYPQEGVARAVLDGRVEAGTFRTGLLEEMARRGELDLSQLRVLNQRHDPAFPFLHTTRLHPEWPVSTLRGTSEVLAHDVAVALLRMPQDHPAATAAETAGWTVPLDYQSIHTVLKELRAAPYAELGRLSVLHVLRQYWAFVAAVLLGLVAVAAGTIYVLALNRGLARSKAQLESEIAERKWIEHQLLITEKMSALGQLASGIAHEMNTPLGYVYANVVAFDDTFKDVSRVLEVYRNAEPDLPAESARLVNEVTQAVGLAALLDDGRALLGEIRLGLARVKDIVRDVKVLSHAGDEDWQSDVDIHEGLRSTLNLVRSELASTAVLQVELGLVPKIECVASQLNQVVLNLLLNARDAVTEAGLITVRTGTDGDRVFIEISDNGQGMSKDVARRIFDPFFTTKSVGSGTGLGLAIVHRIIAKHHGEIRVESEPGRGTTMRIVLPRQQLREVLAKAS